MKKYLFIIALLMIKIVGWSQLNRYSQQPNSNFFVEVSPDGWVKFRSDIYISSTTLFTNPANPFQLNSGAEMRLEKTEVGVPGMRHYFYNEYYSGLPVLFGHFIAHEKDNKLLTGNGKIYSFAAVPASFRVSSAVAIQAAINYVKASSYWWQDNQREEKLKRKLNDRRATYFPTAIPNYHFDEKQNVLRPCYKIVIQAKDPGKSGEVYLYADDGSIFLWNPLENSSCDPTAVNTVWYGNRTVNTSFNAGWDLQDNCTGAVYSVYDYSTTFNSIFHSSNNQWTGQRERSAATALWCIRQARNVYKDVFNRDGHNNSNGNLDIYFDYVFSNNNRNNASYHYDVFGDDEINVGAGDPGSPVDDWGALDILAHEFTHGVTRYTCNLLYQGESGALNESFSDIFGEFVEGQILSGPNWIIGSDRKDPFTGAPVPLRYMKDPNGNSVNVSGLIFNFNDPNTYLGENWFMLGGCSPSEETDNCGVHTNSGVQNHMFYLLSEGGFGYNNGSNAYAAGGAGYNWNVQGIGISKAITIAYFAMRYYLSANSSYFDARNAWVHAAEDLYGACSNEAIQTGKAWYAVGMPPPASGFATVCGNYGLPYSMFRTNTIDISPGCMVNVLASGNLVQFVSGTKILLRPGFNGATGSRFKAAINSDCLYATY